MQSKKPIIKKQAIISSSRLFSIEQLDLEFSNGEQRQYERLLRQGVGAVLIIPMLDDETVLLIREYCGGTDRYELGLPKGKMDEGEDILQAANRELKEEVGYQAEQLDLLKTMTIAPQYMEHTIHIVLAQQLTPKKEEGDEPEPLEVVPYPLADLEKLIADDAMTEARTIAALYMARERLK